MRNLLSIVAIILIIGWAIGFIGFGLRGLFNMILVIACVAIVFRLMHGKQVA